MRGVRFGPEDLGRKERAQVNHWENNCSVGEVAQKCPKSTLTGD